jgi:hypothetical protein
MGYLNWTSSALTDHDGDGCFDSTEDMDDDNDGVTDSSDLCFKGALSWQSSSSTDYDSDGCQDATEDLDDDNDRICDAGNSDDVWACTPSTASVDLCPTSSLSFFSNIENDADRDGCEDANEDVDDDNDGFTDDVDTCPRDAGTSSLGLELGCDDYDSDGYSDATDVFPTESTQWLDSDQDGYGDNSNGFQGDGCTDVVGDSTEDRFGCPDADTDGWSDVNDDFPNEVTQHSDTDADGFGDAINGFQGDECLNDAGTSTEDRFGCLDSDSDGWSDLNDAFPSDNSQHSDDDGDGYGDNPEGTTPDSCLGIYGLSSEERYGCPDADGDGWENRLDAYEDNPLLWSDSDGDGYADQTGTNLSDDCPDIFGSSSNDVRGCLDSDGDGWSDDADQYPNDASKYLASESSSDNTTLLLSAVFGIIVLSLAAVVIVRRKNTSSIDMVQEMKPIAPLPQMNPASPPLPPGGLPAGWTMEQWAWYGEDYLKNQ